MPYPESWAIFPQARSRGGHPRPTKKYYNAVGTVCGTAENAIPLLFCVDVVMKLTRESFFRWVNHVKLHHPVDPQICS